MRSGRHSSNVRWASIAGALALVVFCGVQGGSIESGIGEYVERQRAALAGSAPPVTVDHVMRPWIARSVQRGLLAAAPLLAAAGLLLAGGRGHA